MMGFGYRLYPFKAGGQKNLPTLRTEIDDLLLPYTLDLSLYSHIDNADLLDHIQRAGKLFYQREVRRAD